MKDGPSTVQDAHYRRGVVLGLTIGEAILLILFGLLLMLTVPLIEQTEINQKLVKKLTEETASLKEVRRIIERAAPGKGIDDLTKEYALMVKRIQEMEAQLKQLGKSDAAFQYLVQATQRDTGSKGPKNQIEVAKEIAEKILTFKKIRETIAEILDRDPSTIEFSQLDKALRELAVDAKKSKLIELSKNDIVERLVNREGELEKAQRQLDKALREIAEVEQKNKSLELTKKEIAKLLGKQEGELKQVQRQLENTQGQMENLKRQISRGGRGVEAVPCWSKSKGKPEYIFDVALTTNGLTIRDRKLPHRKDEQSKLPLDRIIFERELTRTQFLNAAKPLYDWSVSHKCRFFVRAFDKTANTEKKLYKQHLRYLGERFYHYEELNEQF